MLTVRLRRRGSAESKPTDEDTPQDDDPLDHRDDPSAPWPVRRGGAWLAVYRNSLSLAFAILFVASFLLHALTGSREFNSERAPAGSPDRVSASSYLHRSRFGSSRSRTGSPSSWPPRSC